MARCVQRKSISEKLKLEVLSGNYDIVTVETGVNEISNFKKKPKDFVETIAFRLMELNFTIKDIQSEVQELPRMAKTANLAISW